MISKVSNEGRHLMRRASDFAATAHEGQTRKYTGEPYFSHCAAVAKRVSEQTNDAEVIAAAYLHDVIEDTDVTYNRLVNTFGPRVADIVLDLTDVYTPQRFKGLNRRDRKRHEALRLKTISPEAKLVKLADIEDNTRDIVPHDPGFAAVFLREKADMLSCLSGGDLL